MPHVPFTQVPLKVTSYETTVRHQNQETDLGNCVQVQLDIILSPV